MPDGLEKVPKLSRYLALDWNAFVAPTSTDAKGQEHCSILLRASYMYMYILGSWGNVEVRSSGYSSGYSYVTDGIRLCAGFGEILVPYIIDYRYGLLYM